MASRPKPKVLVVDDERVIADTLAIILNQHGLDASAVYTGTAAVERARPTVRLTIVLGNTTTFLSGKSGNSMCPPAASLSIISPLRVGWLCFDVG